MVGPNGGEVTGTPVSGGPQTGQLDSDSRTWGPVSEDRIVGKAVAVWMQKEAGLKLPSFSQNRWIVNPD